MNNKNNFVNFINSENNLFKIHPYRKDIIYIRNDIKNNYNFLKIVNISKKNNIIKLKRYTPFTYSGYNVLDNNCLDFVESLVTNDKNNNNPFLFIDKNTNLLFKQPLKNFNKLNNRLLFVFKQLLESYDDDKCSNVNPDVDECYAIIKKKSLIDNMELFPIKVEYVIFKDNNTNITIEQENKNIIFNIYDLEDNNFHNKKCTIFNKENNDYITIVLCKRDSLDDIEQKMIDNNEENINNGFIRFKYLSENFSQHCVPHKLYNINTTLNDDTEMNRNFSGDSSLFSGELCSKENTLNNDTFNNDTLNNDTLNDDTFNDDTLNDDTLNDDTFNDDTLNVNTLNIDTINNVESSTVFVANVDTENIQEYTKKNDNIFVAILKKVLFFW